mgnify:CR=1 FL=1
MSWEYPIQYAVQYAYILGSGHCTVHTRGYGGFLQQQFFRYVLITWMVFVSSSSTTNIILSIHEWTTGAYCKLGPHISLSVLVYSLLLQSLAIPSRQHHFNFILGDRTTHTTAPARIMSITEFPDHSTVQSNSPGLHLAPLSTVRGAQTTILNTNFSNHAINSSCFHRDPYPCVHSPLPCDLPTPLASPSRFRP